MNRAQFADALTASRLLAVVLMPVLVGRGQLDWAAVVVTLAWLTDFFDGRLARSAEEDSKLGHWDFRVDATVGLGILIGLWWGGFMPWWVIAPAVLAGSYTAVSGNPAPAMTMLAVAYGWFLPLLIIERQFAWWLPLVFVGLVLILDWTRFFTIILPSFFRGIGSLIGLRSQDAQRPVLDDWAD